MILKETLFIFMLVITLLKQAQLCSNLLLKSVRLKQKHGPPSSARFHDYILYPP